MLSIERDVGPSRLHAAGLIVVLHDPELEVERVTGDDAGVVLAAAVNVHGDRRRAQVVHHVEAEPVVVDAGLYGRAAVEAQDVVVDGEHEHRGVCRALWICITDTPEAPDGT